MIVYDKTSSCFLLVPVTFPARGWLLLWTAKYFAYISKLCICNFKWLSNFFFLFRLKVLVITLNIICCNQGTGAHLNWHMLASCNLQKCFPGSRWAAYCIFNISFTKFWHWSWNWLCRQILAFMWILFKFGVGMIMTVTWCLWLGLRYLWLEMVLRHWKMIQTCNACCIFLHFWHVSFLNSS